MLRVPVRFLMVKNDCDVSCFLDKFLRSNRKMVVPTSWKNDELMTLGEFKAQWIVLLRRQKELSRLHQELHTENASKISDERSNNDSFAHMNDEMYLLKGKKKRSRQCKSPGITENGNEERNDPYCCKHLRIAPSHELIDLVVNDFIARWRALDQRKINAPVPSKSDGISNEVTTTLPKWYEKHVRLPEQFDYATVQGQPPHDDGVSGDRVVSLVDPTATTSYQTELWKLFADIPTRQQLEDSVCDGSQLVHTCKWFKTMNSAVSGQCTTAQWEQLGLSKLRMNDRHDLPPPITRTHTRLVEVGDPVQLHCGLLRFECLRKQLRRSSTPDSNRMILEFLGSQTLLEVHEALVELTDDEFWRYNVVNDENAARSSTTQLDTADNDAVENRITEVTGEATEPSSTSSGYFFIENTFYVSGSVDYVTPILNWLQKGTKREQTQRLKHLGIDTTDPCIRPMKDIRLYDLPTRLGVRYVHVHHGDVECAIFVTDRRLMPKTIARQFQFPIIYDIWTPSYNIPDCEVCQNRAAVIATATNCAVTRGHRALCEQCSRQLHLQISSRDKIERYTVWRSQSDISAGASKDTAW
jgi:snRNA-activating protein complex (SNAPc), subunit 3